MCMYEVNYNIVSTKVNQSIPGLYGTVIYTFSQNAVVYILVYCEMSTYPNESCLCILLERQKLRISKIYCEKQRNMP